MVRCKACGCNNADDEIFCTNCGKMIMTSEYLGEVNNEENDMLKFPDEGSEFDVEENNNVVAIPQEVVEEKAKEEREPRRIKKNEVTIDGIKYQGFDEEIQEFYISPDDDEVMRFNRRKKIIIIGASIALGVILLVLAVVGIASLTAKKQNLAHDIKIPSTTQVIKAMNKDEKVTVVKINGKNQEFEVTSLNVISEIENEDNSKYIVKGTAVRENEMYRLSPVEYKIVFENKHDVYIYISAKVTEEYKTTITPVGGVSVEEAQKQVEKEYKKVKFDDQKTDLKKGEDRVYFNVKDKDKNGRIVALYKFNKTKGWLFKKIGVSKMNFKPGVTHKVDGLLTNSAVRNIMFFGVDADGYSGRSDVMMLVSIDTNTSKIKFTSFMRDTYVDIPGYGSNKLNSAFALGGPEAAVRAIENTYKIKIDNYAATNFTTFKNVINHLGGVNVNVTADEAGYINWQIGRNGQASVGYVSQGGGNVKLNGQQALWLCRDRGGNGFSGDDFSRTGRQRKVLESLINSYKSYSPSQVLTTLNALKGNVQTDLDAEDFKWLAQNSTEFFKFTVQGRCAPDHGEWHAGTSPGGAWIIQFNDWNQFLKDVQKDIYEDLE